MEFGRLSIAELEKVDFTLPAEPERNANVLPGKPADGKVYVGMPQWGRKEWEGELYKPGSKPGEYLSQYASHFNTVELNATHYNIFDAPIIQKWASAVADEAFRFCPKMFKGVTHSGPLHRKGIVLEKFLDSIESLGKALGPIFIQLSEYFSANRKRELFDFIESLPTAFNFFLELRHPALLSNEALFDYLQTKKVGAVITDTAGRRDCAHMHITTARTMVRFICNNGHPSDYTRIDEWAERLKNWLDHGISEIYFFVHMSDESKSLAMANYAIKKINEICNQQIKTLPLH